MSVDDMWTAVDNQVRGSQREQPADVDEPDRRIGGPVDNLAARTGGERLRPGPQPASTPG
jgi:hypothetical protein